MQSYIIRKAKPTELAAVQDLSNELGLSGREFDAEVGVRWASSPEGIAYFQDRIAGRGGVCFVAEADGEPVGFISGSFKAQNAWILIKKVELDNIFVSPEHRNRGIGKKLLHTFETWAMKVGAKRISVNAFYENKRMADFCRSEGFVPYDIVLEKRLV